MTALVKQISMLCFVTAIGEQLLKDRTSFACLRMIVAGKIALSVFSWLGSLIDRCAV